jgi:hypothetical protein
MVQPDPIKPFWRSPAFLISGLLFVSVAAAYEGVSQCGFVDYDDGVYVAENPM